MNWKEDEAVQEGTFGVILEAVLSDTLYGLTRRLVWKPGFTGIEAITPPNAQGERLAGCFLMILPGVAQNDLVVIEDSFGLSLTSDATARFLEALVTGREHHITTVNGSVVVDGDGVSGLEIVLLNPDDQIGARGVTESSLAIYIRDLERVIKNAISTNAMPETFRVVVAVRPPVARVDHVGRARETRSD